MNAGLLDRTSRPAYSLPAGSCDCHVHLFDAGRFPYVVDRTYTPGTARVADLNAFEDRLGIERVVLVQPSVYGIDNAALLDGLRQLGPDRARGVAVIDPATTTHAGLQAMHDQGVRGIRLNLAVHRERDHPVTLDQLRRAAGVVGPFGWAIQIYTDIDMVAAMAPGIAELGVPVVLDHFAGVRTAGQFAQPGAFDIAIALVSAGHAYVKLSAPYRASKQSPHYTDLDPFAIRLIDARPDRMVWASDWPHTGSAISRGGDLSQIEPFRNVDAAHALDRLSVWAMTDVLRRRILVENPANLYGFAGPTL
ncbi:amidohydrolase family protein [Paraburkholderia sp. BL25I1N1]|uniref:amidohydrolase family protein n=1 Tax=Paraburkholderia sp. BL25I1N1 TaxID=1938804 RepID=UPI0015E5DECC|nr:amidohydrolase family protein [Paraburkholderia sp. BL25I1N1]